MLRLYRLQGWLTDRDKSDLCNSSWPVAMWLFVHFSDGYAGYVMFHNTWLLLIGVVTSR